MQDKYQDLVEDSFITSWSVGETRDLVFTPIKPKTGPTSTSIKGFTVPLQDGCLFVMGPTSNERYNHSVPVSKTAKGLRESYIFRAVETHV